MAKKSLNVIKKWFKTGLFPTQTQFWDVWDSFFHKDDQIPASQVENLQELLDQKIDKKDLPDGSDISIGDVSGLRTELDDRENKVAGKGLSTHNYTTEEKNKLTGVEENANNYQHPSTHPASMINETLEQQFVAVADKTSWYDALIKVNAILDNATVDGDTLRKLYDLIQALKENVPEAGNSLEKVYNLITGITNTDKEYANITARNADVANLDNGESIIVSDARDDSTVVNGWAIYRFNKSTQTFLKLAEQESIDVNLSQYMKFTDLVTQYQDEPAKPVAASLVKALKDIVDGLPHDESDLDHDKLNRFYKFQHLQPGKNLYSDGYSLNAFQGLASGFMNFGAMPLTKLDFNVFISQNKNSSTYCYVEWELLNEDGTSREYSQEFIFTSENGGEKSINVDWRHGYRFKYGDKYSVLRLVVSPSYPNGDIVGYGTDQSNFASYLEIFSRENMSVDYKKKEGEYSIILAVAYLKDSQNTKSEDVQIWNFTEIQQATNKGLNLDWYGVEWDPSQSLPDCKRIGNLEYHRTLPIQSKIKRCMLWDNGTIHYYLDADDSTKKADGTPSVLDGSHGQVMVEVPEFYCKHELDGSKHRYKISDRPIAGFRRIKKFYISAYEASMERSSGKLSSILNFDPNFRGGNNNASWDETEKSLCGKPITKLTRGEFRIAATSRGVNWHQQSVYEYYPVVLLFAIEYATFDSQKPIDSTIEKGMRKGGLGPGATTAEMTEWGVYNSYNPAIQVGITNPLGNKTGEVPVLISSFGGEGVERIFTINSYRGIENIFGHIFKFLDGLNINDYVAYATDDMSFLADNIIEGYEMIGVMPSFSGYQNDFQNHLLPLPLSIVNNSDSGAKDYYFPSYGWRAVRVGGYLSDGSKAGVFNLNVCSSSSVSHATIGARLCFRNE